MIKLTNLTPDVAPQNFRNNLDLEMENYKRLYKDSGTVRRLLGIDLDAAIGISFYAHFLEVYKDVPKKESMIQAFKKFLLEGKTKN